MKGQRLFRQHGKSFAQRHNRQSQRIRRTAYSNRAHFSAPAGFQLIAAQPVETNRKKTTY